MEYKCKKCGEEFRTKRAYELHKIREEIIDSGESLLNMEEIQQEVANRRGATAEEK